MMGSVAPEVEDLRLTAKTDERGAPESVCKPKKG